MAYQKKSPFFMTASYIKVLQALDGEDLEGTSLKRD